MRPQTLPESFHRVIWEIIKKKKIQKKTRQSFFEINAQCTTNEKWEEKFIKSNAKLCNYKKSCVKRYGKVFGIQKALISVYFPPVSPVVQGRYSWKKKLENRKEIK